MSRLRAVRGKCRVKIVIQQSIPQLTKGIKNQYNRLMKYDFPETPETQTDVTPIEASVVQPAVSTHGRMVLTCMIGVALIMWGLIGGVISNVVLSAQDKIIENNNDGLWKQLGILSSTKEDPVKGEEADRINVLILGYGGEGHPGGGLTDTIMVASLKPSTDEVVMISIPRDLVVNFGGKKPAEQEWRKINYAMDYGGVEFAQEKVEEVLGLPIHYYVSVDFDGFRQIIDDMGGVDVYVENAFTDRQYPDYNYGYQVVNFEQGWQHMTGEKALQFARSRHGNHGENTDFARSARQQIIINAVREELLSAGTILNPTKILSIFNSLGDHVRTNAEIWELAHLATLAKDIPSENIVSRVIDQGEGGFLESEIVPETGAYVLLPKAGLGDYSEIQQMASTVFDQPELVKEEPTVVIQNGTKVSGLGARTADLLRNSHYDVTTVANATARDNATTVIYDLSGSEKPVALTELASLLHVGTENIKVVSETELDPTIVNTKEVPPGTDFVVVLGLDYSVAEKANE